MHKIIIIINIKLIKKYVDEITATTMQLKLEVRHTNRHQNSILLRDNNSILTRNQFTYLRPNTVPKFVLHLYYLFYCSSISTNIVHIIITTSI